MTKCYINFWLLYDGYILIEVNFISTPHIICTVHCTESFGFYSINLREHAQFICLGIKKQPKSRFYLLSCREVTIKRYTHGKNSILIQSTWQHKLI